MTVRVFAGMVLALFVSSLVLAGCMAGVKATPGAGLGWQAENPGGKSTGRVGLDLGTYEVTGSAQSPIPTEPPALPPVTVSVKAPPETAALMWAGVGLVGIGVVSALLKRKAA